MLTPLRAKGEKTMFRKNTFSALTTLGILLTMLFFCSNLYSQDDISGIWTFEGTHSTRGDYSGELEIRSNADGSYNVIRIANYHSFVFKDLNVQELWTGTAHLINGVLSLKYNLKAADYITRYNNEKRRDEDFAIDIPIAATIDIRALHPQSNFQDSDHSSYYKEEFYEKKSLNTSPLWVNQKELILAEGAHSIKADIAKTILMIYFNSNVKNYWKDPFVQKYKDRPEFKANNFYFIFDPTDFRFYQENKNVLRVVNKKIDNISLLETLARQRAYSHPLHEKAEGFDKNYVEKHMTPQGLLAEAQLDDDGNFLRFVGNGDGALWAGVYGASQAMKYLTLKDSDPEEAQSALENVKRTARGLFLLMDIMGDPKEFARTAIPMDNPNPKDPWRKGTGAYADINYIYGGNNDMIKGLFSGFLWAALTVPKSDTQFWNELKDHSLRLANLSVVDKRSLNLPLAIGIAAVVTGDPNLKETYERFYILRGKNILEKTKNFFKHLKDINYWDPKVNLNIQWPGYLGTSGIHLVSISNITQILIADALGNKKLSDLFRKNFMAEWVTYYGLQRHQLSIAAYAFGSSNSLNRRSWFGVKDLDKKWQNSMDKAIWGLREFPYPRLEFDVEIDYSKRPDWCLSSQPQSLENSKGPHSMDYFYQGLYEYPIFQKISWGNDYVWKSEAYSYKTGASKNIEHSSADYLFAYWMARWSHLIGAND